VSGDRQYELFRAGQVPSVYSLREEPGVAVQPVERKLAAIFAADIAGYSRLMAHDEVGTLARLKACRVIIDGLVATHRGRIFNTAGDSVIADFASAVDAVACAVAMQNAIATEEPGSAGDEPMRFRIGVHVGDVVVDGANLLGEGVNIAARLEAAAEPGAICVSAVVRDQVGNKLPIVFTDLGEQRVKNIPQPIRVYRAEAASAIIRRAAVLPLPDKPSIAVLPFQNMSGDPDQEYFADGMVEEIITALSRIRWLFVIARNSSFTYKGQHVDVKQAGRELGVRYVLEGSVRKAGNRVRITVELIEAESGANLWAERFDGSLEDVFDFQDQVAISIAGVIEPTLQAAEVQRASRRSATDLTAYDLYLRAYAVVFGSPRQVQQAVALLDAAISRDPNYGPALGFAAFCCMRVCNDGSSEDMEADRRKGIDYARRALEAARDDPSALSNSAATLAYFGEEIGAMLAVVDRALSLNPSYARGWNTKGFLSLLAGDLTVAIKHAEAAARLSPRARIGSVFQIIGAAHLAAGHFEEAASTLALAVQDQPEYPHVMRLLAACYAHMGRVDDANEIIKRLRAITPRVFEDFSFFRKPEHRDLLASGLRLAIGETQ
jgi:adenylate cyclase